MSLRFPREFFQNLRDAHRENTPSNKTQALTKNVNMDIWVHATLNFFFIRGSSTVIEFSKK